ncbi:MAG: OmpA family protein [Actinomycetota bacterium]
MATSQERSRPWSFSSSLVGAIGALALAVAAFGLQSLGLFGDDESADGELSVVVDTAAAPSTTVALLADAASGIDADGVEVELSAARPPDESQIGTSLTQDGITSITMRLADPTGLTRGVSDAELQLNAETGQICYSLSTVGISAPYPTTIRRGLAGADGAVVVDLGEQPASTIDCDPGDVDVVAAILADPTGHYLELVDPNLGVVLRSQLAASDVAETGGVMFDPDGGGATVQMADGVVTLVGVVESEEIAEQLVLLFGPPADSDLVLANELRIVSAAPPPSGRMFITGDVLFEISSDQLVAVEGTVIEDLITFFLSRPDWQILVVGHTDATGDESFNVDLSQRRAEAVRAALIDGGVAAESVAARGSGSSEPIADNSTAEGRAENRRIEFTVTPGS